MSFFKKLIVTKFKKARHVGRGGPQDRVPVYYIVTKYLIIKNLFLYSNKTPNLYYIKCGMTKRYRFDVELQLKLKLGYKNKIYESCYI